MHMRLVVLLLAPPALGIVHDEQAHVTVEKLHSLPEELPWVVLIHSGRCGTCIGFQPVWQRVLRTCKAKVDADVKWGEFDVDQPRAGNALQRFDLDVFPTVVVFAEKFPGGYKAAWSYPDDGPDDSSLYPDQPVCDAILRWAPARAAPAPSESRAAAAAVGLQAAASVKGAGLEATSGHSVIHRVVNYGGGLLILPLAALAGCILPCMANALRRQFRSKPP